MPDILTLDESGWLRDGEPWEPDLPFFAVLGDPIGHSLSPVMQNAALTAREIDAEYLALQITAADLPRLKDPVLSRRLMGFNVTAPHKEAVAGMCEGKTDQARELGAVNTVKVEDGNWLGHNTDSGGLMAVAAQIWGDDERPDRVVVLGAGGAARAAVDAMLRWGVPQLEVRNRSRAGRERLRTWLQTRQSDAEVVIGDLVPGGECAVAESTLWVCCLAGGVPCVPYLPVAAGAHRSVLMDLRYGDQRPEEAAPLGFDCHDGLSLLLMQGGLSFAWWNGPPVPWTAMRDALLET